MALDERFPKSPYEIINPKLRWLPDEELLRYKKYDELIPPLVRLIREDVKKWRDSDYEGASETSKTLLKFWFYTSHRTVGNNDEFSEFKYYFAQQEAVETIIYLHEIAKIKDKFDLFKYDYSKSISHGMFEENWVRFVIKMATGSGKTKVLSLIIAWSFFNRLYESKNSLSRNFLIITPNIIVLDRIKSDFNGLKIFFEDPILPENGYCDRNWKIDFNLTVHIQDNVNVVNKTGNIFLTNIHRVYDNKSSASFDDEDKTDYFLGKKAVTNTLDSGVDLDVIVRDIDELMVLNDEAHHVHSSKLEWFKSIADINNHLIQKGSKLSMQVDFTATPKNDNGSIFVQTVSDYPLVEAIYQNIVKLPVLPDYESRTKLNEKKSSVFSERFEEYIHLGYEEWKKTYNENIKMNKKSVLFIMVDDTKNCDEIGEYLEKRYLEFENSVLVIHTNRDGSLSAAENKKEILKSLRKAANEIDNLDSPYKAIVSVLVLKEGWDVRNVTTIVGLRTFSSKSQILPEQTLGRGLRLMYPGEDIQEKVSVIGTEAFIEFVESIEKEGVILPEIKMDAYSPPIAPMIIEIDLENPNKNTEELNIKIPILSPKIIRDYTKINDIKISKFDFIKAEIKEFIEDESAEIKFHDLIKKEFDHSIILNNNSSLNYRSVISFYAQSIMKELRLNGVYDIIYGKLKSFIKNYFFKEPVNLDDSNILKNIVETKNFKTIMETFKKGINDITVQSTPESYIKKYINLKESRPFVTKNQEFVTPKKSVFNKIVGDSNLELQFAKFLEHCDDIISYTKNYLTVHFTIDYQNSERNISNYYPDFIIKKSEKEIYIVETKGNVSVNDIYKINRLEQWCNDINNIQNEIKYNFLYVEYNDFNTYNPKDFNNLIELFKGKKPIINL